MGVPGAPEDAVGTLELAPGVAREVLEHALDTAPDECCGILLGPAAGRATRALRARNVHEHPRTRYRIDPEAQVKALELADEEGLEITGFYHSHPRGHAAFSDEDVARGAWEGAAYLLVSLAPLTFLAGRWDGEGFEELFVRVADTHKQLDPWLPPTQRF